MDALAENPRAIAGANNPPESTPYEIAAKAVEDIYSESILWLNGKAIDSPELADGVSNLLATIRKARNLAEETRKAEKKPHDDAAKAVQELFKPLLDKADLASDACKKSLAPWLAAEQLRMDQEAAEKRKAAVEAQRVAEEAIRATEATDLAARAAAEALIKDAKKATASANKAEKQTAAAGGTMGRATGLRTVWIATMTDSAKAGKWGWTHHKPEILECIAKLAQADVSAGKREIEGFEISEQKRAV